MQYIVNQVVYDLNLKGITPEYIDSFSGGVCGLEKKLTPSFFSDRYVRKQRAHIRAFGSEVITALDVLCLMLQVLDCGGPHHDILTKARLVMSVLLSGDAAVGQLDRLEAYMYNLHCAFLVMYPPMRHTEAALDAAHLGRLGAPQAQHPLRRGGEDAQADEDVRLVLPTTNFVGRPSRDPCGVRFETLGRLTTTNTQGWGAP